MTPLSPIFAIIIFLIAYLTAFLINIKYQISNKNKRYENIDGLRGFLGLGVFICHCSIWYQYLQIGSWELPKSNLYTQLGQTSVSLFFMISAFLFISKLLNVKEKIFDWNYFFISRIFRLVPMYIVSISILILIVFIIGDWEIKGGIIHLLKSSFHWYTFTIISSPQINKSVYTSIINAGVVWSLPYEWLFYFSLPLISLLILKNRTSFFFIIISTLFIFIYLKFNTIKLEHIYSFIGGAIAPFILKYDNNKIKYNSIGFSCLIIICMLLILQFKTSNNIICKTLIATIFTFIALGNNIFKILKSSTLKLLGEICYSTYLMHGIIIFIVIYFGYGIQNAAKLSPEEYCLLMFLITPIVVIISFLGYKYIENPFMIMAKKILISIK